MSAVAKPFTVFGRTCLTWSAEENQKLIELRAAGKTHREIADVLGRSINAVEKRLNQEPSQPKEMRRCLCCGHEFRSQGAHNRLCSRCRFSSKSVSPYAL